MAISPLSWWADRFLFKPALLFGLIAVGLGYSSLMPQDRSIPGRQDMLSVSGRIVKQEARRGIKIAGQKDRVFRYPFNEDPGFFRRYLCVGCDVTIWLAPGGGRTIFQLESGGTVIRSYDETRARMIRDRRTHPYWAITSAIFAVILGLCWAMLDRLKGRPAKPEV